MVDMLSAGKRPDRSQIAFPLLITLFAVSFCPIAADEASLSSDFLNSGCVIDGYKLNCSSLGLEQRFGCYEVANASAELEALDPRLPIVECDTLATESSGREGLVRTGCMLAGYRNYIIEKDGDFRLIRSREEFAALYAPVQSQREAMAFAVALTNSFPLYDTAPPEGYFSVSSAITPSSVEEKDGSFVVHLFDRPICGCGSHPYYAVEYLVTGAGNLTELSRQKVFDSNAMICVD